MIRRANRVFSLEPQPNTSTPKVRCSSGVGFIRPSLVVGIVLVVGGAGADPGGGRPAGYRPIPETGNNVTHPTWGTPGEDLVRGRSGAHYADGISAMAGAGRPSPRVASDLFAQTTSIPSRIGLSDYIWTWGQFLDHDLDLTEGTAESAPVAVPAGDPFFDPSNTGTQVIPFHRGLFDPTTGFTTPRQQVNEITGFIDGSNVYGSSDARAQWLRTMSGGTLKVTATPVGRMLPFNDGTQPNAGSPEKPNLSTTLFVSGDIRVNEQPTLACMHTLFVREHNRLAAQIAAESPELSDDEIYQRARAIVIGELEHVTYDEFLPALLGPGGIGPDRGYDPNVDPSVRLVFSGAAYRLGHTLLSPFIQRLREDGSPIPAGPLALRDAFFSAAPPLLMDSGIEPFLRGLVAQRSQELDSKIIDDVRNFLFGQPGQGGLDLVSLNVQRGRDFGLPDFNTVRADYGLKRKRSFAEISSDPSIAAALAATYGLVDNIDAFVGFFTEDDVPGGIVGDTLRTVIVDQFVRSRAGDRFWYERTLSAGDLKRVHGTRLSDVIRWNTTVRKIKDDVFFVAGAPGYGRP